MSNQINATFSSGLINNCLFSSVVDRILFEEGSQLDYIQGFGFQGCIFNSGGLDIPEGLERLDAYTFEGSEIYRINLPSTLKILSGEVFSNCHCRLRTIILNSKDPVAATVLSANLNLSFCTLYVPKGTIDKYSQAKVWKGFGRIVEMEDTTTIEGIKYILNANDNTASILSAFDVEHATCTIPRMISYHDKLYTVTSLSPFSFINSPVEELTIPSSVDYIGECALDARVLKKLKLYHIEPPKVADMTESGKQYFQQMFSNMLYSRNPSLIELHVPVGSKSKYQSDRFWGQFKRIIEDESLNVKEYKLTYLVNGKIYKDLSYVYGDNIVPEAELEKEGYTFSGWSEIPKTMPAKDVTVSGSFTVNSYKLTFLVDGSKYLTYNNMPYGTTLFSPSEPERTGYTFSGWSEIPETMPAEDVTITGTFTANSYKLTYKVDGKVYKKVVYEYGATITPEPQPEGDYLTFWWVDLPKTMPAHDVVVQASYTTGIMDAVMAMQGNVRIYAPNGKKRDKLQKGLNIVALDDGTVKKMMVK